MKLKCKINGNEYPILQGATFSEEYNETLDSGTIIIDHVPKIEDLMPYDDVYIYEDVQGATFGGYHNFENINPVKETYRDPQYDYDDELIGYLVGIVFHKDLIERINSNSIYSQRIKLRFHKFRTNENDWEEGDYTFSDNTFTRVSGNSPDYLSLVEYGGDEYFYRDDSINYDNIEVIDCSFKLFIQSQARQTFYKHLLVDQFTEEIINLTDGIYKYKIELFSETKKLETIQLPNVSITQPLNIAKKRSVYDYIVQFVSTYTPKRKFASDDIHWYYDDKYLVHPSLKEIFGNVYSPDFTLNNPSLRDVLAQLMLVKDRIPYVQDDVIMAMDITQRNGVFNVDTTKVNYITGSRSSDNTCDNLRRTYNNALSQENSCKITEFIGFRNSDSALMTLANMRLETRYPIYKINKIYMCYYKKIKIVKSGSAATYRYFLCKQDITKLVKLNSERNLLSQDWDDFTLVQPTSIDEMARYKLCTVGYDIGSNYITGFGTTYTYPIGWWDDTKTYIENIFSYLDSFNPYGIYNYGYITRLANLSADESIAQVSSNWFDRIVNPFSNNSLFFKSLFFEVEYNAFYNGSVVHSKDGAKDDITINDNSSSSLTLLEQDGLFQKEKINRFGNKAIQINARYYDPNELQKLGSVYDDDVIIYHREYSIYGDMVNAIYYGTKDYVLKNYFTSVYAKHRTYNLMSYGESVTRAENKKMMVLLSKDKCYFEKDNKKLDFSRFGQAFFDKLLSAFKSTPTPLSIDNFNDSDKINCAVMEINGEKYASDINEFVSGNSICFNIRMFDNVSGGVYFKKLEPLENESFWDSFLQNFDPKSDYTGTMQDHFIAVDDEETGAIKHMSIIAGHIDYNNLLGEKKVETTDWSIRNFYFDRLFMLPYVDWSPNSNAIECDFDVNKDNKEVIDMTFQIEPYTDSQDIVFSHWFMQLSDLLATYRKFDTSVSVADIGSMSGNCTAYVYSKNPISPDLNIVYINGVLIRIPKTTYNTLDRDADIIVNGTFEYGEQGVYNRNGYIYYKADCLKMKSVGDDSFDIDVVRTMTYMKDNFFDKETSDFIENATLHFTRVTTFKNQYNNTVPLDNENYYYFDCNISNTLDASSISYCGRLFAGTQFTNSNCVILPSVTISDSTLSITKEYAKNMFIVASDNEIDKTIIYNEYKQGELNVLTDVKVEDIFRVDFDDDGKPYIDIDYYEVLLHGGLLAKSVQFWYLDNGSYHFVFGVNKGQYEDSTRIYLSLLSTKDTAVYDMNNIKIGNVANYCENNQFEYGKDQLYLI